MNVIPAAEHRKGSRLAFRVARLSKAQAMWRIHLHATSARLHRQTYAAAWNMTAAARRVALLGDDRR